MDNFKKLDLDVRLGARSREAYANFILYNSDKNVYQYDKIFFSFIGSN
jgi:hypothetical protein